MALDAFFLEIDNPEKDPFRFHLIFSALHEVGHHAVEKLPTIPPVIRELTLPSGYSRHTINVNAFQHLIDRQQPFTIALAPEADRGRVWFF